MFNLNLDLILQNEYRVLIKYVKTYLL